MAKKPVEIDPKMLVRKPRGPARDYAAICARMGDLAENDPARIERIGVKLVQAWSKVPYIRLGQFMVNITGVSDPFYEKDSALEKRLDEFLKTGEFPVQGG